MRSRLEWHDLVLETHRLHPARKEVDFGRPSVHVRLVDALVRPADGHLEIAVHGAANQPFASPGRGARISFMSKETR